MRRRTAAQACPVKRIPLNAGAQHKQNGIHRIAVGNARIVTAQGMRLAQWQQRLDLLPQLVRNTPSVVGNHQTHANEKIKLEIAPQKIERPFS
jgi:hypothetical protein